MDNFVVGFAFSNSREAVLLVEKKRPEWMKGLLNGIGGSIEEGESSLDAMRRECEEETGLCLGWECKGIMRGINNDGSVFVCHIFYAYSHGIYAFKQKEDELLIIHNSSQVYRLPIVANLNFLIPYGRCKDGCIFMALDYRGRR